MSNGKKDAKAVVLPSVASLAPFEAGNAVHRDIDAGERLARAPPLEEYTRNIPVDSISGAGTFSHAGRTMHDHAAASRLRAVAHKPPYMSATSLASADVVISPRDGRSVSGSANINNNNNNVQNNLKIRRNEQAKITEARPPQRIASSSAGDYSWFDDNLFQLRPEEDTSTFRLHSRAGTGRGRHWNNNEQSTRAVRRGRSGGSTGSYVRPGRTLRLGAATAVGGANAQVGPIDVASIKTNYEGPERVREKNIQRHRARRAERAMQKRVEAEANTARQSEEMANQISKESDSPATGDGDFLSEITTSFTQDDEEARSTFTWTSRDTKRDSELSGRTSSLVTELLSPRSSEMVATQDGGALTSGNQHSDNIRSKLLQPSGRRGQRSPRLSGVSTAASVAVASKSISSGGDDWSEGERILATLKTGEDAISFFAKEGNRTAVKFVYLVKSDSGDDFRPYDLDVIPSAQVSALIASSSGSSGASSSKIGTSALTSLARASQMHYVMTEKGLTRMTRDPITGTILPSEVIPISTWMRESSVFNVVSNMRFFRTYLPRKAFSAWRRAVRLKVYQAQRERLARRLFLARPTFCKPLVEIVGPELYSATQVEVQDFKSPKAFEMAVFAEKQAAATTTASKKFESCMSLITKSLLSVCRSCKLRRQHFAQLRERDDDFDTKERNRHKSIVVLKEEKAERDQNERQAHTDFMSLGDLVRFVDYMCVDALVTVAVEEQSRLEAELRQPRIKQGLWETTVKFARKEDLRAEKEEKEGGKDGTVSVDGMGEEGKESYREALISGMLFKPNMESTLDMIVRKNEGVIEMMDQVTRVSHIRRLRTHLRSSQQNANRPIGSKSNSINRYISVSESPQVGQQSMAISSLIRSSPQYIRMCAAIEERIKTDFQKAADYAVQFEAVREIFDFRLDEYDARLAEERRLATARQAEQEAMQAIAARDRNRADGGSDVDSDNLDDEDLIDRDDGNELSMGGMDAVNVDFAIEAAQIRAQMDNCETWSKRIERMRAHGTIGVLYVESRKLKNCLQPITEKLLEHLEGNLNELARERCKIALDGYKKRLAELDDRPPRLADFANFVATTQRIESEKRRAFRETGVIDEMYRTLNQHRVRVQTDDMVQLDGLKEAQEEFKAKMEAAEEYIFTNMSKMTQNLDMSIAHLNEQVHKIQEELTGDDSSKDDTGTNESLILAERKAAEMEAFVAKLKNDVETIKTQIESGDADDTAEQDLLDAEAALARSMAALEEAHAALEGALESVGGIFDNPTGNPDHVLSVLAGISKRLDTLQQRSNDFSRYQRLFGKTVYTYKALKETTKMRNQRYDLWSSLKNLSVQSKGWMEAPEFRELDAEMIGAAVTGFHRTANMLHRRLRSGATTLLLQRVEVWRERLPALLALGNVAMKERHWVKIFSSRMLGEPYVPGVTKIQLSMLVELGAFEEKHREGILSISSAATGEASIENQVQKIARIWEGMVGHENEDEDEDEDDSDEESGGDDENVDEINKLNTDGSGGTENSSSHKRVHTVESIEAMRFILAPYRDGQTWILSDLSDVLETLEDHRAALQTMLGSRFVMGVQEKVALWVRRLDVLEKTLDSWTTLQRSWMYLETIFVAPDIQQQLPDDAKAFKIVDTMWRQHMRKTSSDPTVIRTVIPLGNDDNDLSSMGRGRHSAKDKTKYDPAKACSSALLQLFEDCNASLDKVLKSLRDFLETKRSAFPRFYFLGDDELLDILSRTRDPSAVQPYLSKCFDAIKSVEFARKPSTAMKAMKAPDGERVKFSEGVYAEGPVEYWLREVETMMMRTTRDRTLDAISSYPALKIVDSDPEAGKSGRKNHARGGNRIEWVFAGYPAQCIIMVDQIMWTRAVVEALAPKAKSSMPIVSTLKDTTVGQRLDAALQITVDHIQEMVAGVRGKLNRHQRRLAGALITLDVHGRDVIRSLKISRVETETEFEWTKQLKYVWDQHADPGRAMSDRKGNASKDGNSGLALEGTCIIHQTAARLPYTYEYLGNSMRLVVTPLTDLCYLTLSGALNLKYGGAPAGPAGTGKTETVKDLGKALARQVVVFNCSDGLDYLIMGRFFSGLAQAGAWACFDEFNRIEIEVLSVIAQQILCIQQAIVHDDTTFEFVGREIPLDVNFGVFITMNPGYAGRTELPDNLKALFRPVAMMVPNYRMIAEIILYSQGFEGALDLSRKMTQLYKLASEQLSRQSHYDFGMRAVKSVLVAAGQLKRRSPDAEEDALLIKAMEDSNVPKFLRHDLPLFSGIVADLFPEHASKQAALKKSQDGKGKSMSALQRCIISDLESRGLEPEPSFVLKVMQVHETQLVRHGMMVVGEACSGKSEAVRSLSRALAAVEEERIEARSLRDSKMADLAAAREAGDEDKIIALEASWAEAVEANLPFAVEEEADPDLFLRKVRNHRLNPKALSAGQLYGEFNGLSGEWTDGLVPHLVRKCVESVESGSKGRSWVSFDGPVDAVWIENMNTVLDDNMTLCLANSERIRLPAKGLHMMFEVADLVQASPATVSRCGMVVMEQEDLGVGLSALVKTWTRRASQGTAPSSWGSSSSIGADLASKLGALVKKHVIPLIMWCKANAEEKIQTSAASKLRSTLQMLGALLGIVEIPECERFETETKKSRQAKRMRKEQQSLKNENLDETDKQDMQFENETGLINTVDTKFAYLAFVFSCVWGIGGNISTSNSRTAFSDQALSQLSELLSDCGILQPEKLITRGGEFTLYDYYVSGSRYAIDGSLQESPGGDSAAQLLPWSLKLNDFAYKSNRSYFDLFVPTPATVCQRSLLSSLAQNGSNVLLVGETGVGKSVVVQALMDELERKGPSDGSNKGGWVTVTVGCSAQTSAADVRTRFETKLDRRRRNTLIPSNGKMALFFVDDVNMPVLEEYGAQPSSELLRQAIDHGGFHDVMEVGLFVKVKKTVYVAACGPPGGGRNTMTDRLVRHFVPIWCPETDASGMQRIFGSILRGFLDLHLSIIVDKARVSMESDAHTMTILSKAPIDLPKTQTTVGSNGPNTKPERMFGNALVAAAVDLYESCRSHLRPTPSRTHYTFNLRDLSKVFQGMLRVEPTCVTDPGYIVDLWRHEVDRAFRDRLIDDKDRNWFSERAKQALCERGLEIFIQQIDEASTSGTGSHEHEVPLFFGSFMNRDDGPDNMSYERIDTSHGLDGMRSAMQEALEDYSLRIVPGDSPSSTASMDLVFFDDALSHLSRACRVLGQPRGSILLVGLGGSGRRSLARLASFVLDQQCREIQLTRTYGVSEWRMDLKEAMLNAGLNKLGRPVTLLISDTEILNESFLENLNCVLNSGDVPNLYENEDKERIMQGMRTKMSISQNYGDNSTTDSNEGGASFDKVFTKYVSLVRENFRLALALSPAGSRFRERCRNFPSLVNCSTIDWYEPWPTEALQAVAKHFLFEEMENPKIGDSADSIHSARSYIPRAELRSFEAAGLSSPTNSPISNRSSLHSSPTSVSAALNQWAIGLCDVCVEMHRSVEVASKRYLKEDGRFNYVTPTSYLQLLRTFVRLLVSCRDAITDRLGRYETGLDKLLKCGVLVEGLQQDLIKMQPILQKKEKEIEVLLVRVERDRKDAAIRRDAAAADATVARTAREEVQAIKDECQSELNQAMPAYYAAVKALETLDKKSITEVKSYVNPPEMVDVTMQAVCILLGIKPEWKEAKLLLNDMGFLQRLLDYDKDSIPGSIIRKIKKFVNDPRFEPKKVGKVSEACRCLCSWVLAMHKYDSVVKLIGPKKIALGKAEDKLAVVEAELAEKKSALATIEANLAQLEAQYNSSIETKRDLERRMAKCKTELERANRLTTSLADEKVRWNAEARSLRSDVKELPGNVAVASANIAYLGAFTAPHRKDLTNNWVTTLERKGVPIGGAPNLSSVLGKAVEIRQWRLHGLPADEFSTENGIMATRNVLRWPLMIDPQRQANNWVRKTYGRKNSRSEGEDSTPLYICKPTAPDILRTMENAVRYGAPVLLEDVPETGLDAVLDSILLRQLSAGTGGQMCLTIGDNQVPYDPNFRLFITTRIANPHFLPEMSIKVSLINFSITMKGLEDQLLVDVVQNERPELEERRDQLVLSIAADQAELSGLENQILSLLANAGADILEDEELIITLQKSKVTSTNVKARVQESEKVAEEVSDARNVYRPVAIRGSVMYFCVSALAQLDAMYQYSLSYYAVLYRQRIVQSMKSDNVDERIQILIKDITVRIYQNICRGLFDRHRLLFSFRIAAEVQRAEGKIGAKEWKVLLAGGVDSLDEDAGQEASSVFFPDWCERMHWRELLALKKLLPGNLDGIDSNVRENSLAWAQWAESGADELPPMPVQSSAAINIDEVKTNTDVTTYSLITPLIVTRVLRKDKLVTAVRAFVKASLGAMFIEPTPFDLEGCYNDSTNSTPLIFVLSSGANPMESLLKAAANRGKRRGMKVVSLGQGQGPIAETAMKNGARSGEWVVLENCHLAQSWLPVLDNLLTDKGILGEEDVHPDFRLWLTSMPCSYFPVPTLQKGIKITTEPPRGLKANLRRTFADLSLDEYEKGCAERMIAPWTRLVFALSFYNAVCLERKKFGAVGWNKQTDWMNSDLKTAMAQLKLYLEEVPIASSEWGKPGVAEASVPLQTLTEVIGAVTYGGRITDRWDKRCNVNLLAQFFRSEVVSGTASAQQSVPNGLIILSESGLYRTPEEKSGKILKLDEVRAHIENMPDVETPEVFGLGSNAAIVFSLQEADTFLSDALKSEAGGSNSAGSEDSSAKADSSVVAEEQSTLKHLRARLPNNGKFGTACDATVEPLRRGNREMINPIGVFAGQEAVQLEALWQVVDEDLAVLADAVVGLAVMSDDNERSLEAVRFQKVPPSWLKAGYPSLKSLSGWIDDFVCRWDTLESWIKEGPPIIYWLSGYFFPQGWITGVLQTHSRMTGIPVDKLGFDVEVCRSEPTVRPRHGAYIHGLFLQGARWDRRNGAAGCLADAMPGELFDKMPPIKLLPVEVKENEQKMDAKKTSYSCPVYKTLERRGVLSTTGLSTNFIVSLELQMSGGQKEAFWIRRGAAMIAALD